MQGGRNCKKKVKNTAEVPSSSCIPRALIHQLLVLALASLLLLESQTQWSEAKSVAELGSSANSPHIYWDPKPHPIPSPTHSAPVLGPSPAPAPGHAPAPTPAPHTSLSREPPTASHARTPHVEAPHPEPPYHDHEHHEHHDGEESNSTAGAPSLSSSSKNESSGSSSSSSSSYMEAIAAKRHGGGKKEGIIAGVVFSCIFAILFFIGSAYIYMTRKYNLDRVSSMPRSQIDGFIPPVRAATPYSSFS